MFNKEEVRCLEFVNKWVCGDSISGEDIDTVAYADLSGLVQPFVDLIKKSFVEFMERYGEAWDDASDPWYPSGPFHEGYTLGGHIYITDYTGDAGNYWNDEDDERYTICRPW
mgnify:FL=1